MTKARSRIDRVYINQHLTCQLDRHYSCAVLEWCRGLSTHRPLSFARRSAGRHELVDKPLPLAPLEHADWPRRVGLKHGELLRADAHPEQPLRRLLLLKEATREVAETMASEQQCIKAISAEDKLGWTLRLLRAAEEVQLTTMARCADSYPYLAELVNVKNPNARSGDGLRRVREHALEFARGAVTEELQALETDSCDDQQRSWRKEHILVRLKRLLPGDSLGLNATISEDGVVTTDPAEMAGILRSHWGKVFTRRPVDNTLLGAWLRRVCPRSGGGTAPGLPPRDSDCWAIRHGDIKKAIATSGNTMPGPDRIPYVAWRKLGKKGVATLFDAATELMTDHGLYSLNASHMSEGGSSSHDFNLGIMCGLPKKATGVHETHGDYYEASATRPLSIVNTDNRLLASAARTRWEPIFNAWVSQVHAVSCTGVPC